MPVLGGCLCFDLPTGTKFIGGIYLFCAIINTLTLACVNIVMWVMGFASKLLRMMDEILAEREEDDPLFVKDEDPMAAEQREQLRELLETVKEHIDIFQIMMLVCLALAVLSIITSSMLIHGVRKRCRGLLVPWIVQEVIHIILAIGIIVLVFVLLGSMQSAWATVIPMFVCICIQIYFIIVVISQFQALELIRMQDEMCMK